MAASELDAAIAVTRFGLGARRGDIAAVGRDPRAWLKAQIRRDGADQPQAATGVLPSYADNLVVLAAYRQQLQAARQSGAAPDPKLRQTATAPVREALAAESLARARLAAQTDAGFRERWTLFWSNHFTVSAKSLELVGAAGPFDREAIRPNVFGRFEDLLVASTRHPAMLVYLDQAQSTGPQSPAGRRLGRGLNENLAREVLELHTVGADAGYTQADVTEFARALTGWTVSRPAGSYMFRAVVHEPGERRVMGRTYADAGDRQARAVLADLAANPATGRRIARKLAAHFIADDPPASLVERLSSAWTRSGGDLAVVAAALVDAPEAWAPAPAKLKTPYEFLVSAYRGVGSAPTLAPREVIAPLNLLGQRPFGPPQPNGWSDEARDWAAPDALVKRLAWARTFAARYAPADAQPVEVAEGVLGARLGPTTWQAVARAESRAEAFTLLLMSPEFQRR